MTERKYTDEEVIKALECHNEYTIGNCSECPYFSLLPDPDENCVVCLMKDALDLINRQKRLLELSEKGLKIGVNIAENWEQAYKNAKAEAIKEFAEWVKVNRSRIFNTIYSDYHFSEIIDTLVKEKTEGKQ